MMQIPHFASGLPAMRPRRGVRPCLAISTAALAALCANPAALAGLVIVGALIFVAIFAPVIAGYVSPIQPDPG